jgi:branched-chain amino acid transport system substrate-binding protein
MSRQCSKGKVAGFLFLSLTVVLLIALIAGCAPASTGTPAKPATPASQPLVIGVPASLNSPMKDAVIAAQLAADEIGSITIDGVKRPIKIVSIDDRDLEPSVPAQDSILAYQNLISQKPDGIVSALIRSEVQLAIMQNTATDKIVQINGGGVNSTWQKNFVADPAKFKYQFKISPRDIDLVGCLMSTLGTVKDKFGFSKIYLFGEDVDFARAGIAVTEGLVQKAGWQVMGKDFIPLGTTDYSAIMNKFKGSGAEVGFYLFSTEGAPMPRQYAALGLNQFMLGSATAFYGQKTWDQSQGAVNGFCIAINGAGNAPIGPKLPKANAFFNNWVAKAGRDMGSSLGISETYDGVYLLTNAWKALGTTDPDKVVAYMETNAMDGAIGHITFTAADHQCPYGPDPTKTAIFSMMQWQDGKRVTVWPASVADADVYYKK